MRTPYIITAVAYVAALASCTVAGEAHLYNNTGGPVTVNACGSEKRLLPGETFRLQDASWCKDPLLLSSPVATWTYKSAPLGWSSYEENEFVGQTEIGNRLVRFQVNRDGEILVVPVTSALPIATSIRQPNGFPAKPDASAS